MSLHSRCLLLLRVRVCLKHKVFVQQQTNMHCHL
jgi:hypothetical protein